MQNEMNHEELLKLLENMYALSTPQFLGTNEEMITAVQFWVSMVATLRSLFTVVTNHDNKTAIIESMEKELAVMKAELLNLSAKPTSDGGISMVAPIPVAATIPTTTVAAAPAAPAPVVDLSVREAIDRARRNAGLGSVKPGLSSAIKKYQNEAK